MGKKFDEDHILNGVTLNGVVEGLSQHGNAGKARV